MVKKETNGPMQQLDANVKRSLFARKITSLLKDEHPHLSLEADGKEGLGGEGVEAESGEGGVGPPKETSSSFSKTLSSNSSEMAPSFKSDPLDQILKSGKTHKNEWI